MILELRLYEDILAAGETLVLSATRPRALYTVVGKLAIGRRDLPADEGFVASDNITLVGGSEGAAIWRWELAPENAPAEDNGSVMKSVNPFSPERISDKLLLRLDSVAFPPGGCAFLHTHQGPGIRCLMEGSIRIDTEGRSTSYGPGGSWFEAGPEPVFAQADQLIASRFIRAMVLPRALMKASSIRYVNEEDKLKPKSQSYRVFDEAEIDRTSVT